MSILMSILAFVAVWVLSAVAHEADMARNFKKTGDAKAWFFEIKGRR